MEVVNEAPVNIFNDTKAEITELIPGTIYDFTVYAMVNDNETEGVSLSLYTSKSQFLAVLFLMVCTFLCSSGVCLHMWRLQFNAIVYKTWYFSPGGWPGQYAKNGILLYSTNIDLMVLFSCFKLSSRPSWSLPCIPLWIPRGGPGSSVTVMACACPLACQREINATQNGLSSVLS